MVTISRDNSACIARFVARRNAVTLRAIAPSRCWELSMNIIWFLVIGLIAGWLAGTLVKGGGFGLIGDLVVGVIGAVLGGYLFGMFGVSAGGGLIGSLIVATIGAVVLLFLVRLIKRA
jgi:uncharacterized membrane protein YeaQ/YmgE (transglycosylase-associated protein family)